VFVVNDVTQLIDVFQPVLDWIWFADFLNICDRLDTKMNDPDTTALIKAAASQTWS